MGINASGTAEFCLLVEALTYFFPAYYYTLKVPILDQVHWVNGFVDIYYYNFFGFSKDTTDILLPPQQIQIIQMYFNI